MEVTKSKLLEQLDWAKLGVSAKPILEQSDCFVFSEGYLYTFNDDILTKQKTDCGLSCAVNADTFVSMLSRFPDDTVDIQQDKQEIVIKGKRKKAGIACEAKIRLPFAEVPTPKGWIDMTDDTWAMLFQAAQTCGKDESQPCLACACVTPDTITGAEQNRIYRATVETGAKGVTMIPARNILCLDSKRKPVHYAVTNGWLHLRYKSSIRLSVRCHQGEPLDEKTVKSVLSMSKPTTVKLPSNLAEIVGRAEAMTETGPDARVKLQIVEGMLHITSRKDAGWYKESRKCKYRGPDLVFHVHPKFLLHVLSQTTKVLVEDRRMKVVLDNVEFVTALELAENQSND